MRHAFILFMVLFFVIWPKDIMTIDTGQRHPVSYVKNSPSSPTYTKGDTNYAITGTL